MSNAASLRPTASPRRPGVAHWLIIGLVCALAPLWLFFIAAFSGLGPATAAAVFAAPVIVSTIIAIWAAVKLGRAGARGIAITMWIVTAVAGALGYFVWINLALLGLAAGDGPL